MERGKSSRLAESRERKAVNPHVETAQRVIDSELQESHYHQDYVSFQREEEEAWYAQESRFVLESWKSTILSVCHLVCGL